MDILLAVLVVGGLIVGGMLLHHFGQHIADGADHPVLKVLGIIIAAIGIGIGAAMMWVITNAHQQIP